MKFIDKNTIKIDRELSELDRFTLDFINIIEGHVEYVLVSGYVSILLGRARVSEDVDIIIQKIDFSTFKEIFNDLKQSGFYCLNAEKDSRIYEYLKDNLAVRFAKKDKIIPNIELKWANHKFEKLALENAIDVILPKKSLRISNLELQIAFKEVVLKSPKDMDDAEHIKEVAKDYLDDKLIRKYREMLHGFYKTK